MGKRTCSVEGCQDPVRYNEMCRRHAQRFSKGQPLIRIQECPACGATIPDATKNQRYCNADCSTLYWSEKGKRDRLAAREARGAGPWEHNKGQRLNRERPEHGTSGRYASGCRCEPCRKARNAENTAWRIANPDKFSANQRRYRRRNPRVTRPSDIARAAAPYTEAAIEYAEIVKKDPCVYCGGPSREIDHILAVTKGGDSEWDNLAPACKSCNSAKGVKSLLEFLAYRNAA